MKERDPICPEWVVVTDYTAVFETVPVGEYRVRVEYEVERADTTLVWDAGAVAVR